MWERQLLKAWIEEQVDLSKIWEYTSLGLVALFEDSPCGFAVTHGQFQQAMLQAGYSVYANDAGIWLFNPPVDLNVEDD
jgi:hypothetical protein